MSLAIIGALLLALRGEGIGSYGNGGTPLGKVHFRKAGNTLVSHVNDSQIGFGFCAGVSRYLGCPAGERVKYAGFSGIRESD